MNETKEKELERSKKGAYYTPLIWVTKAHEYISNHFGNNWQNEYVIWDCCTGSGRLLNYLTNGKNIFVSTLDESDILEIKENSKFNHIPKENIFQFDFLNDSFSVIPKSLQNIIKYNSKKLLFLINPPYSESGNYSPERAKKGITQNKLYNYKQLFAQFFMRIYTECKGCILCEFSTLSTLQGNSFKNYREEFQPKLEKMFVVPGNSFDNVKGEFPIGFKIWDTSKKEVFTSIQADVFDSLGTSLPQKMFISPDNLLPINNILKNAEFKNIPEENRLALFIAKTNGFQTQDQVFIINKEYDPKFTSQRLWITNENQIYANIFIAITQCIQKTWLNGEDRFFCPSSNEYKIDIEFINDCAVYSVYSSRIKTEFNIIKHNLATKVLSNEAKSIELIIQKIFELYHSYSNHSEYLENASFFSIRKFFRNNYDDSFKQLMKEFNEHKKSLASKIENKARFYGFFGNTILSSSSFLSKKEKPKQLSLF